jgi:hypothetical protein
LVTTGVTDFASVTSSWTWPAPPQLCLPANQNRLPISPTPKLWAQHAKLSEPKNLISRSFRVFPLPLGLPVSSLSNFRIPAGEFQRQRAFQAAIAPPTPLRFGLLPIRKGCKSQSDASQRRTSPSDPPEQSRHRRRIIASAFAPSAIKSARVVCLSAG